MKVTLIASCVAGTTPDHFQFLSSTLINDTLAVDAGCLGFHCSAQEQARIRHILLTHSHMDHVASLPIFVENAYEGKPECVTVHASSATLDNCRRDLFNDRVWPDFITMSQGKEKFVKVSALEPGQTVELEGLQITAVAINHVVPTVAYIVRDERSAVAFVSDTGPTEEIWQRLNALPNLKAVFLEATFPESMRWLADVSRHLTPRLFAAELRKLDRPVRVIAVHIKARFRAEVVAELQELGLPNVEIGRFGAPYVF